MATTQLPTSKTALFEFTLKVTDLVRRQRYMSEAFSCRLPDTSAWVSGDAVVTDTQVLTISNVTTLVVIYSFLPLLLDITNGTQVLTGVPCAGLFSFSGALTQISVRSPVVGQEVRFTYAYA